MAEIISFNKTLQEQQDEENGVFAVREDDGSLKDIAQWDGDDWQALFEGVFIPMSREMRCSVYDLIADFMQTVLGD